MKQAGLASEDEFVGWEAATSMLVFETDNPKPRSRYFELRTLKRGRIAKLYAKSESPTRRPYKSVSIKNATAFLVVQTPSDKSL